MLCCCSIAKRGDRLISKQIYPCYWPQIPHTDCQTQSHRKLERQGREALVTCLYKNSLSKTNSIATEWLVAIGKFKKVQSNGVISENKTKTDVSAYPLLWLSVQPKVKTKVTSRTVHRNELCLITAPDPLHVHLMTWKTTPTPILCHGTSSTSDLESCAPLS